MEDKETAEEAAWIESQRAAMLAYLEAEGAGDGALADEPEWWVSPYVALWAVPSVLQPDLVGWWAISGDVPTDYISSSNLPDARAAMLAFSQRWSAAADSMQRDEDPVGVSFGPRNQWPELARLLEARASLLAEWAADDELWTDE